MTKAEEDKFWSKQRPESRIKALLVSEYFPQYCRILEKSNCSGYAYIDLWAGRGKYDDGAISTPLLLGDQIAKDANLRQKVRFIFNDLNNIDVLKKNFVDRFGTETFQLEPRYGKYDAETAPEIKKYFNNPPSNNRPALLFFDPFGYAGIDTSMLASFMKPFGNELFLFLNVNRVIPALTNPKMKEHIAIMFPKYLEQVLKEVALTNNNEKKVSILIKYLSNEFRAVLGDRLLHCAFRFMESGANKTSHLIMHFTKHHRGYKLVKQVFYDYDNIGAVLTTDGTFTFDAKVAYPTGVLDFSTDNNHIQLADILAKEYAGQEITAAALIDHHHPVSPYAPTHYTKALRLLVDQEKLSATFTDGIEHRVTVLPSEYCILKFPPNGTVVD